MPNNADIAWFKREFGPAITAAVAGTPFTLDMMVALACQETGSIWPLLRRAGLSTAKVVELCVGDTLDSDRGRSAFPKDKAELLAHKDGDKMFAIGHESLKEMAAFIPDYRPASRNPNKFCHGYGIFQFDIQFFKTEPDYFLERRWADFSQTLGKAIGELKAKMKAAKVPGKTSLTDMEMAQVAIAYNRGSFDPAKGLKQGFKDSAGRFYGENFADFLKQSRSVAAARPAPAPAPGGGPASAGSAFEVTTAGGALMLRSGARKAADNVIGQLDNGQKVTAVSGVPDHGFLEVDAVVGGKAMRGFASMSFLKPA